MAVYQISRIQIRRGQANVGTGIPQLASGEMAWAVDTQELYIGNGSVAEGAPAVGNTRLLTLNDLSAEGNLLELTQYSYAAASTVPINTGPSPSLPVYRTIQARLDDQVTSSDFGTAGDGVTDDTAALQRAINQLFLNSYNYAYGTSANATQFRTTLYIPSGIYLITSTIYIPSYTTIVGAGRDKVIFNYQPAAGVTTPAFQFVNDTSTASAPSSLSSTQYSNQPRYIKLEGMTINTINGVNAALQLDAVRSSHFQNIKITGNTSGSTVYNTTNIGIIMNAFSSVVTCEENYFQHCMIVSTTTAVYAQQDILNNTFSDCFIQDAQQGFVLGKGSLGGSTVGQQFGPRQTHIVNVKFLNIKQHGVYLERGEYNSVENSKMSNVGNNNAGNGYAQYPQIYYKTINNSVQNLQSDRGDSLTQTTNTLYAPEVGGNATYQSFGLRQLIIGQVSQPLFLFRVPVSTDQYGVPVGSIGYAIDYVYKSTVNSFTRTGQILISADIDHPGYGLQVSDEYNYAGSDASNTNAQLLTFTAGFLDIVGSVYTGAPGQVPYSIAVYYTNTFSNDAGRMNFSYTAKPYYLAT